MLKKLVIFSIISVNLGYTALLFPLLGTLYPSKVPLTVHNLLAFLLTDTAWGIILALVIYTVTRITKVSLVRASTYSVVTMWIIFWVISTLLTGDPNATSTDNIIIIGTDGIAALVTWSALSGLIKHYLTSVNTSGT